LHTRINGCHNMRNRKIKIPLTRISEKSSTQNLLNQF